MALITDATNLDYLITPLRLHIGDLEEPYTYSDDELRTRLVYAVKALAPRWNYKYLINNDTNYIERNINTVYLFAEPPLLQYSDERAIILQASIDIKNTALYLLSASTVSWKDDEVSYSNKDSMVSYQAGLLRDLEELMGILPAAGKQLVSARKSSLKGFTIEVGNTYEG